MKKKDLPEKQLNLLEMIPVKCMDWKRDEAGSAVILKPKFSFSLLQKYLLPHLKKPNFKIVLDEKGSYIWEHIDGKRSVKDISEVFAEKFGEDAEPLFERLGLFLQQLERNRFISYIQISE